MITLKANGIIDFKTLPRRTVYAALCLWLIELLREEVFDALIFKISFTQVRDSIASCAILLQFLLCRTCIIWGSGLGCEIDENLRETAFHGFFSTKFHRTRAPPDDSVQDG